MKLWYSFTKELKLSSKSFYFYIEIGMAALFLAILLLVVPEDFSKKSTEFIYLDLEPSLKLAMIEVYEKQDMDGQPEQVEIKSSGKKIDVDFYELESKKVYMTATKADLIQLADTEKKLGIILGQNEGQLQYDYYLQGYESNKIKNLYQVLQNTKTLDLQAEMASQEVRVLSNQKTTLSDRQHVLPSFLTFNGSLMGLFIIASYIFLDKKEGIISAYAVTASSVWQYLLSKVGVILVTSTITSFILVIPLMGFQANYLMLFVFLICSGFFASTLGLVITSYYKNIMQSFGVLYVLIVALLLPNIAYFMPTWQPIWIKFIPSYYFLESFKEIIIKEGDMTYVAMVSAIFFMLGLLLFVFSNHRFKKTLTL